MKAIEFKSKIKNNQIAIPLNIQSELISKQDKSIRVILLIDDAESSENKIFQKAAQNQFLKGYSESDSIYDN